VPPPAETAATASAANAVLERTGQAYGERRS
jgi:hypothetical protein